MSLLTTNEQLHYLVNDIENAVRSRLIARYEALGDEADPDYDPVTVLMPHLDRFFSLLHRKRKADGEVAISMFAAKAFSLGIFQDMESPFVNDNFFHVQRHLFPDLTSTQIANMAEEYASVYGY